MVHLFYITTDIVRNQKTSLTAHQKCHRARSCWRLDPSPNPTEFYLKVCLRCVAFTENLFSNTFPYSTPTTASIQKPGAVQLSLNTSIIQMFSSTAPSTTPSRLSIAAQDLKTCIKNPSFSSQHTPSTTPRYLVPQPDCSQTTLLWNYFSNEMSLFSSRYLETWTNLKTQSKQVKQWEYINYA